MSNFDTKGNIILQAGDELPWKFRIDPASSSTGLGAIPYGTNVATVQVTSYDMADGTAVTDLISETPSVDNNIVTVTLQYPATNGEGRYKITILCTLDTGNTRQFDFTRIYAVNI